MAKICKRSTQQSSSFLKLSPLTTALLAGFSVFTPALSSAEPTPKAVSAENNSLPDMGTPVRQGSASVMPGPTGITAQGRFDGTKITIAPEYSDKTGVSLGVALATMLGDQAAVGVILTGGADKREVLINAGFKLDERQRFIVTAGQLKQFLDYAFVSGTEKAGMTQNSGGVSYQLQLGKEFLRFLELNGYVSKTASRDLADKTFAIDTATVYELWNDPRRIAGGQVGGLQGKLGFSPIEGSTVKVSLGYERLSYDLLVGKDVVNRPTGGLEWLQKIGSGYQIKLGAETFAAQQRYTLGLERSIADGAAGRHNIGLNLIGLHGRDGLGNDNQLQLTYSYLFGASSGGNIGRALPDNANAAGRLAMGNQPMSPETTGSSFSSGGSLLDQVAVRPSFLPGQVLAKVDKSALPTRLIAVDKTALPVGTTINNATGDVTVPLGVVVTGIAGVTRNLAAFANAGQFGLTGNSLLIKPSLIVQPAVGITDSYVVTINNQGGGTTVVTILVTRGSVKIDSIVVTAGGGDATAPVTTSAPAISVAATATTVSVTQTIDEAGTGYYLLLLATSAVPTVAEVKAGTSFAMSAATPTVVNLSGLTASTNYKYYFVAKDAVNNDQAAVSTGLAITTAAGVVADVTPPPTPATLMLAGNAGASAGFTNTQNIGLTVANVTDPSGVSWFVSESSSAPAVGDAGWSSTQPTSFTLSAGETAHTVYVYVKDNVGNVQATGKSAAITLDQTLPTVSSLPSWAGGVGSGSTTAKTVTFGDTAGGSPKAISISADNGASITGFTGAYGSQGFNLVAPINNTGSPITVTITYSVTDNAGNSVPLTTQTVSVAAVIDTTPPPTPATLTAGQSGIFWNNNLLVNLDVAPVSDPSGVSWFISQSNTVPSADDPGWSATPPTSITLPDEGIYTVYVFVKDNAANVQPIPVSTTFGVDITGPM